VSSASEVTQKAPVDLDGFSGGYSEPPRGGGGDGDGGGSGSGFPGATKIKFDIYTAKWIDANGAEVHSAVALNVINRVQKWGPDGGPPLETITLAPGEKWPDIFAMNEACKCGAEACKGKICQGNGVCKGEWYEKFGKMIGPHQGEHVCLFVNPDTMVTYWWPSPTSTIGACICIRALMEQTTLKRKFTGLPCHAQVEFTHTHMPTQYGGRERPHLLINGFGVFGDGGFKLLPNIVPTAKQITGDSIEF
jgi:hypothetical protein